MQGTIVEDRQLIDKDSIGAKLLGFWDRLSLRSADWVVTGTRARAQQYVDDYNMDVSRITAIPVSAEFDYFNKYSKSNICTSAARPLALFYGKFAPLHGLPVVLEAAGSQEGQAFDWVFIGTGQEGWRIEQWINETQAKHVRHIDWVAYDILNNWIVRADICLGTFGASRKAQTR